MSGVSTDTAKIAKYRGLLEDLARRGGSTTLGQLAQRFSAGLLKLVADEFATSTDPYGVPWPPLKHPRPRDRRAAARKQARARRAAGKGRLGSLLTPAVQDPIKGPKVLVDTGRMSRSTAAKTRGTEVRVVIPTWYAAVHQDGAEFSPRSRTGESSPTRFGAIAKGRRGGALYQARRAARATVVPSPQQATAAKITIPRRRMLPDKVDGTPPKWEDLFRDESLAMLRDKFQVR